MLVFSFLNAQSNWVLKRDQDGIKVYTGSQTNSSIKAVKVECVFNATPPQLAAVIFDINTNDQWVYRSKNYRVVKKINPFDLYYYAEIETPWPVSNRDFIAHLKISQNLHQKTWVIITENEPDLVPEVKDVVRIRECKGKWVITQQGLNTVKAEYTLFTDPGGNVPAWLINLFITEGPMESFKKLKEQIKKPAYANIVIPGTGNF